MEPSCWKEKRSGMESYRPGQFWGNHCRNKRTWKHEACRVYLRMLYDLRIFLVIGGEGHACKAHYHGTWQIVPFVNRTFEWGVVIATFLSVLSVAPG